MRILAWLLVVVMTLAVFVFALFLAIDLSEGRWIDLPLDLVFLGIVMMLLWAALRAARRPRV